MTQTSVVDARIELDDDGAAPDRLEEVRRCLDRRCSSAAAGLVRAAGAHLSRLPGWDWKTARILVLGLVGLSWWDSALKARPFGVGDRDEQVGWDL